MLRNIGSDLFGNKRCLMHALLRPCSLGRVKFIIVTCVVIILNVLRYVAREQSRLKMNEERAFS